MKTEKQQTAVEWLAQQINTAKWKFSDITDRNEIIQQAKEMEKEQIKNAWIATDNELQRIAAEEYYNRTYNI
jgi:hypothetical protein